MPGIAAQGGYRYENGVIYIGSWNCEGLWHGEGHLQLPGGMRYQGRFEDGLFNGLGVLIFSDGARYILKILLPNKQSFSF